MRPLTTLLTCLLVLMGTASSNAQEKNKKLDRRDRNAGPAGQFAPMGNQPGMNYGNNAPQGIYPGVPQEKRSSPRMNSPQMLQGGQPPAPRLNETYSDYQKRIGNSDSAGTRRPTYPVVPGIAGRYPSYTPQGQGSIIPTPTSGLAPRGAQPAEVRQAENNPAASKMRNRMGEASPSPSRSNQMPSPQQVQNDLRMAQERMQQALERKDYETLQRESRALERRMNEVKANSSNLPLNDKFTILGMTHMADEANQNLRDGAATEADPKVKLGLQNLGRAASPKNE